MVLVTGEHTRQCCCRLNK